MPTSAAAPNHPTDIISILNSSDTPNESKLKALRQLKNQIIGNRTKKLSFLKLGAVPCVVSILSNTIGSAAAAVCGELEEQVLVQSAATIGSFACGLDSGVKAVLDAGAVEVLFGLVGHVNYKVADAGARSLKLIYQSSMAPKYELFVDNNISFLISLLSSKNENVSGLGASIITHSCQTTAEQHALSKAGVTERLVCLLKGSLVQTDASLESLATMIKNNHEIASNFANLESGRALDSVIELTMDKYPKTRLLACNCLISIRNASASYLQDSGIKNKLVIILLDLVDDPGQVGDEAPFVFSDLISEKEDMQKLAFDSNAVEKICEHLKKCSFQAKRLQGILLALAGLCSKLECCRERVLQLQVLNFVTEALAHDSSDVRAAACFFLKNASRSVKNLSVGQFMKESVASPLLQLLCDSNTSVQITALGAISNAVVDFTPHKSVFMQCGGLKQLVQLSKSMESDIRVNAVWALKNLAFLVNDRCKEEIFSELTTSTLISLISDSDASVREHTLALIRNLVDGNLNSVEFVFVEDGLLLHAIGKQVRSASKVEVLIQGMYTLSNVASGSELHKEAVMNQLLPETSNDNETVLIKFLQHNDSRLRLATIWALINLTFPTSPSACDRVTKLRSTGILSVLKSTVNDPCLDVKLRARTALGQFMIFGDASI